MKRSTLVGILVAVVVVGGLGAAVAISASGGVGEAAPQTTITQSPDSQTPTTEPAVPSADVPAPAETADAGEPAAPDAPSPGIYTDYSDAALAAVDGTAVLFFHAPWCTQCRALEDDIVASGVPDGVTILKVDYDSRQDLRQKYGVTLQTTLVTVDAQGAKVASYVAYDEPSIAAVTSGLGL